MKTLDKKNIQDVMRCTPMQEGMLFHTLEAPEGLQYISQLCVGLAGPVDHECVESAWNRVAEANDALRTAGGDETRCCPIFCRGSVGCI